MLYKKTVDVYTDEVQSIMAKIDVENDSTKLAELHRRLDELVATKKSRAKRPAPSANPESVSTKKRAVRKPTMAMIVDIKQQLEEHHRLHEITLGKIQSQSQELSSICQELSHICADVTLKLQAVAGENSELRAQLQALTAQLESRICSDATALTTKPKSVFSGPGFPQYKPATPYIPDPI
jgi:plasmid maintenance system antidote protein VapI